MPVIQPNNFSIPRPTGPARLPVHRQAEQHPAADEPDADELVLAALDGAAQVVLSTCAAVPRRARGRRVAHAATVRGGGA